MLGISLLKLGFMLPALFADGVGPRKNELYWGREICVIYDYRPMIERKEKAPSLFAIELKNQNGGSIEKEYPLRNESPKVVFIKVWSDVKQMLATEQCDRVEVFYPSEKKMNSEM